MKNKKFSITVLLCLVLSLIGVALITSTSAKLPEYEPIDIGPTLRARNLPVNFDSFEGIGGGGAAGTPGETVKFWLSLDDYNGYYFFDTFMLRAIGAVAEIWVQINPSWPAEDPRPTPVITDAQCDYLLEEFETIIYDECTSYFGTPSPHDGSLSLLEAWGNVPPGYYDDGLGRTAILVSNFGDENYYDPTYPYYIAGFYSSSLEAYFDRNVISIDTYNWEDRVGPDGARPYLYEGVIAHEFQHLIHDDYNTDDPSFMNEGCSMFAEVLCGYGTPWGDINSYMATPDNSLTEWGDQGGINTLADYGSAALWAIYLNDRFGNTFLSDFVQDGVPGIDGLNAAFAPLTFDEVFHDWRLANLLREDSGPYSYTTIDFDSPEANPIFTNHVRGLQWTYGTDFGNTITILGYDTGISTLGNYGTDYVLMDSGFGQPRTLHFDGGDSAIVPGWTLTADGWYSGEADLMDTLLIGEGYVNPADPTLALSTYWDIEDYWDFGFVQISTDGGNTWTSLANAYTTLYYEDGAHPDIIDNLPGLTGWSEYVVDMTFDLTAYAGQTVQVGFRYMTDWAFTYEGWFISDAAVSGTPLTLAPFSPEADFQVTVVRFYADGNYVVEEMTLDDSTETGDCIVDGQKPDYTVLLVSSVRTQGYVDYLFKATPIESSAWK